MFKTKEITHQCVVFGLLMNFFIVGDSHMVITLSISSIFSFSYQSQNAISLKNVLKTTTHFNLFVKNKILVLQKV